MKYMLSLVWSPNLLVDKSTQADSSQITLGQVDLEQIKYTIQPTFLDQLEIKVNIYITYLQYENPLISLLIQAPESLDL